LLSRLAAELGKLPNHLLIEGHTDAKPFSKDGEDSNWELSTDRANAARKLMVANGVPDQKVAQVRGFAERNLRHPEDPEAASNRRVSVIVQYLTATPEELAKAAAEHAEEAKKGDEKKEEGHNKPVEPAEHKKESTEHK